MPTARPFTATPPPPGLMPTQSQARKDVQRLLSADKSSKNYKNLIQDILYRYGSFELFREPLRSFLFVDRYESSRGVEDSRFAEKHHRCVINKRKRPTTANSEQARSIRFRDGQSVAAPPPASADSPSNTPENDRRPTRL